jgi:S-adenosylmethionine:tRNA ribosyltransferase-isomerase
MTGAADATDTTFRAATWPDARTGRLLVIDPRAGAFRAGRMADLPALLAPGDLLVVNDAATLPASLHGRGRGGEVEVRLLRQHETGPLTFTAVLFGSGDWRTPTEHRPAPPALAQGEVLRFCGDLQARVRWVSPAFPRLVDLVFTLAGEGPDGDEAAIWAALYRCGRPVQYSYVRAPLDLWHVQTPYAGRPWAAEAPSAGLPLRWELLLSLRRRGVGLCALTHGAGLSSTGEPALDQALPLTERFELPAATVAQVEATRAAGGRVIAVGTTVVRALEGCAAAHEGALLPGRGETDLRLHRGSRLRVVSGLLTGMHEPMASHHGLLQAFADPDLLKRAYAQAAAQGFLGHEFGDATLILSGPGSPGQG